MQLQANDEKPTMSADPPPALTSPDLVPSKSAARSSDPSHIGYLDGWRGLAIGFLLIGHFFPVPGLDLGSFGVHLFFVLSGLLMSRLLFVKRVRLDLFYRRRISRIVPTSFAFVIAVIGYYVLVGRLIHWDQVAAAAVFLNNYVVRHPADAAMPLEHIWSLSVEEHSYVALSILALVTRKTRIDARVIVGAFTLGLAAVCLLYASRGQVPETHSEVAAFGLVASAFLMLVLHDRHLKAPAWTAPILFVIGIASFWWSAPPVARFVAGPVALAIAVNVLDRAPRLFRAALSNRPLRLLGQWSFSIYLWQQIFYLEVWRNGMPIAVGFGLSLIVGVTSFYTIENPARRALNAHWK